MPGEVLKINPGDILVEKYFVADRDRAEVVSISLVLNRHMESEPSAEGVVRTIYYKTFLLYAEPNDWADDDLQVVLTDMEAPKPIPSNCQRMWMTTKAHAERPYFQTNERVIAIND